MKVHTFKTYKTYRFINKDPIIDVLRTSLKDAAMSYAQVAEKSGVTQSTLHAWFHGETRRPQAATILAVATAIGPRAQRAVAHYVTNLSGTNVIPFRQRVA